MRGNDKKRQDSLGKGGDEEDDGDGDGDGSDDGHPPDGLEQHAGLHITLSRWVLIVYLEQHVGLHIQFSRWVD